MMKLDAFREKIRGIFSRSSSASSSEEVVIDVKASKDEILDVLIVGAGASGIGTAIMLTDIFGLEKSQVLLVERGEDVGESFRQWPEEMKFISPSFNQQGWTNSFDLNAVMYGTSPAFSMHTEHPSGRDYAAYLSALANNRELNIQKSTEVLAIHPNAAKEKNGCDLFLVEIRNNKDSNALIETVSARFIVWAAGEFQYPNGATASTKEKRNDSEQLVGAEHCIHNSKVESWSKIPGDDFIIIGGYESGVDAAVNLARSGKQCKVLASTPCWDITTDDPSFELAPYTADRLRSVTTPGFSPQPELLAPLRVVGVEKESNGGYQVSAVWKALEATYHAPLREQVAIDPDQKEIGKEGTTVTFHTPNPPILCTGFEGSVKAAASHLFEFADDDTNNKKGCLSGAPLLKKNDESTKIPGVYLVGPSVQHDGLSFCFIYKFRQRFAIVAEDICRLLGIDTKQAVKACGDVNMYLKEMACCEDSCGDVC